MKGPDWLVLAAYLASVVGLGVWFGRGQRNSQDFLLGGRSIPLWAALLSLVATEISAATFLGAPEKGYRRDITYLQFSIGTILARIFLAYFFISVFYRARVTTVYEFLRTRFGPWTNQVTAGLFLFGRLFADGSRLFIAAITVEVVTGWPIQLAIGVLAGVTVLYTTLGGIKAVVYTDVAQAVVLVGSGVALLVSLWNGLELSWGQAVGELQAAGKLRFFGGGNPWTNPYHVVTAVVGGFFLTLATHGTDHDMVQRLLTCRTDQGSRRSMWLSGLVGLVVTVMFLAVGLLLYLFISHLEPSHELARKASSLAEHNQHTRSDDLLLWRPIRYLLGGSLYHQPRQRSQHRARGAGQHCSGFLALE